MRRLICLLKWMRKTPLLSRNVFGAVMSKSQRHLTVVERGVLWVELECSIPGRVAWWVG